MGVSGALLERLEALWTSPALGTWAMLAAAAVVALVLFVIVLKADRTLANGALAIITLLALGVASAALMRDRSPAAATALAVPAAAPPVAQGALACLDGLAGERVEGVCEKALFASADATAAAVSYTAAQISRLPVAAAQSSPELGQLRRVIERDRYGLVAQVLTVREGCTPQACDTFRHLGDTSHITANMTSDAFEALVSRYAEAWGDVPQVAAAPGRPSSIEFPSSASIPAVNIMTPPDQRSSAPEPPPIVTVAPQAPPAPLPGSVAYPPASLPQLSIPLQTPVPSQAAAPPASATAANASAASPKRSAAPPARRAPAAAQAPPPVQLVPPAD